ncbi:MAG TPA: hypothetical protein VD927_03240 [Chryseosolibacter sp.]|nr:hypothetical protein [Chryseosolibacter sp.]
MKKVLTLILPLAFIFGCDDDDSDTMRPIQCFVSEAVVTYPSTEVEIADTKEKYVASHTDTYTTLDVYETDDTGNFPSEPDRSIIFTFDATDNTRIVEIRHIGSDPTTYTLEEYSYLNEGSVLKQVSEIINEEVVFERSFTIHLPPQNINGMYVTRNVNNEDVLHVFENNNLTKIGYRSEDGDVTFENRKWHISTVYEYDDKPNASKDIVIAMLTWGIDSPVRFSKNNVIRETTIQSDGTSITVENPATYSQDGKVMSYDVESVQRRLTIEYDCQQ